MTEEQKRKGLYVEKILSPAVIRAMVDVEKLEYEVTERGEEYVVISYINGHTARVCVTADSLTALAYDVFKYLKSH